MRDGGHATNAAYYERQLPEHAPSSRGCVGGEVCHEAMAILLCRLGRLLLGIRPARSPRRTFAPRSKSSRGWEITIRGSFRAISWGGRGPRPGLQSAATDFQVSVASERPRQQQKISAHPRVVYRSRARRRNSHRCHISSKNVGLPLTRYGGKGKNFPRGAFSAGVVELRAD
jgi:hypothetical protein